MAQSILDVSRKSPVEMQSCSVSDESAFGRFERTSTRAGAPVHGALEMSASVGCTYLTPLVVNRKICIFRRTRLAVSERSEVAVPKTHRKLEERRPSAMAIGWFEFSLGPYVFSLNHDVSSKENVQRRWWNGAFVVGTAADFDGEPLLLTQRACASGFRQPPAAPPLLQSASRS